MSIPDLYVNFATAVIKSTAKLDIILSHGKPGMCEHLLPSWVPDWTGPLAVNWEMNPKIPYRASWDTTATVRFEGDALIARGFIIDSVDGLGTGGREFSVMGVSDVVQPLERKDPYRDEASKINAVWRTLVMNRDIYGEIASETYGDLLKIPWRDPDNEDDELYNDVFLGCFERLRTGNKDLQLGGRSFRTYFPSEAGSASTIFTTNDGNNALQQFSSVIDGRMLIITAQGYFGQARMTAQRCDVVCILMGCSVPVILRKRVDGLSYELISDAYIHGVSDGEAEEWLAAGDYSLVDLRIA